MVLYPNKLPESERVCSGICRNNKETISSGLPDTLNLSSALKVLDEHGFPTSKAKLYKMTSLGQIPFMKYGNKLVFSRKSLVEWAHEQLVSGSTDKV